MTNLGEWSGIDGCPPSQVDKPLLCAPWGSAVITRQCVTGVGSCRLATVDDCNNGMAIPPPVGACGDFTSCGGKVCGATEVLSWWGANGCDQGSTTQNTGVSGPSVTVTGPSASSYNSAIGAPSSSSAAATGVSNAAAGPTASSSEAAGPTASVGASSPAASMTTAPQGTSMGGATTGMQSPSMRADPIAR